MENYKSAYQNRSLDIDALLALKSPRAIAATHFGGVAIECLLKSIIITYHGINEWGEKSCRQGDPRYNMPIERTSHALIAAVRLINILYRKALADRLFIKHLSVITHPLGATTIDFIALRYSSETLDDAALEKWRKSFSYVTGWLEKNEKLL